ncbi:MAG: prepilin-type N-terminal cleavage/methylation domain-containing protein [Verrucomicrobia bacterium]|nr:prepilin-type N-terminal cleavage/methylation domain-containing protein [Verrucomicrobiota bacterium]
MKLNHHRSGFTLVEIMIVVAIIALLAAIAVPGFLRARKRAQGTTMKNDLRLIDAAKDQYAIEFNKSNQSPLWADLTPYFKPGTRLATATSGTDLFNNAYVINNLSTPPKINQNTFDALSDIIGVEFWSPFQP